MMSTRRKVKVAIVGSGLAGLAAAHRLATGRRESEDVEVEVHIFEKVRAHDLGNPRGPIGRLWRGDRRSCGGSSAQARARRTTKFRSCPASVSPLFNLDYSHIVP